MQSHLINRESAAVVIIGEPKSEKKECELLANLMYESDIPPESEVISALIGYQFDAVL